MEIKKVAVVYGGWSSEAEISRKSGRAVAKALKEMDYETYELELTHDIACKLLELKPDIVFPVLHGKPGEDGTFQGLLEIIGIPYVGSGPKTSAVCMDKELTKLILEKYGIPTPRWAIYKGGKLEGNLPEKYPLVVKPAEEGSSVGLKIVNGPTELNEALTELGKKFNKLLIEEFIEGKEVTCGFLAGEILPPLEIIPKTGIYDFEAKYTKELTEFAPLQETGLVERLQQLMYSIVEIFEIKDLCRVDFRINCKGKIFVLEINTLPGMTETSLLPKMANLKGYSFSETVIKLLQNKF
jgi:D-alanine-D-alanine ligase